MLDEDIRKDLLQKRFFAGMDYEHLNAYCKEKYGRDLESFDF